MRAALLRDYGQRLELIERPDPESTRPDEVLVKVAGAGVCATDLHAIELDKLRAGEVTGRAVLVPD